MLNVTQIGRTLQTLFGEKAEEVARETKFVQRSSKMRGVTFLLTFVLGFLETPTASLNLLCQVAEDFGVSIRKQGLQGRLNAHAVTFMAQMFALAKEKLENKVAISLPLLTQFTVVHLMDSTAISLPDSQAETFAATGGSGPKAGLKLQTLWDFLRGNLTALWITAGRGADQSFRKQDAYLVPGGLFLADLGYFAVGALQAIAHQDAYFLSRFQTQTGLRTPETGEKFALLAHLQQIQADEVELALWLGFKVNLPVRVLALRLPDAIVAERRRKAKENARRQGRTASHTHLAWLAWSIFVTNVPAAMLTLAQAARLYPLRWQVELLFKLWKSEGQVDRVAGTCQPRILCEVYAKLIGFVLFHYLTAPLRWGTRELSPPKALQTFRRHVAELGRALGSLPEVERVLNKLMRRWQRFAHKDKRRTRLSTCRQLELASGHLLEGSQVLPPAPAPGSFSLA
jgi:hypothetical protein